MSTIVLSHPRICQFYATHKSFDAETINLLFIEILEKITENREIPVLQTKSLDSSSSATPSFQQTELSNALSCLKETISVFHKSILSQWIVAKTNYIHEFKSVMECNDGQPSMEILLQNNQRLVESIGVIAADISAIRTTHSIEKINLSIKQFQKIIHANVESIVSKITPSADISQLTHVFISNFEINAAHMIQTIQQWLGEFVAAKEKNVGAVISWNDQTVSGDYHRILYDLHDSLHHFKQKGYLTRETDAVEHTDFDTLVAKYYPTSSVIRESERAILLSRETKPSIYIEHHAVKDRNIRADEIKQFLRSTQERTCHGILVSQWTGVTSKPHLHIEIHNHRVVVYVHQLGYSMEKLQMAVDIIESLAAKLEEYYAAGENKQLIPKDVLDEINREYQYFICQKETILSYMKESHKKLLSQVDEMKFISLDKFLSTRYSSSKKQGFVCDLCNTFTVHTLKGLAAHKRGCQRKINRVCSNVTHTVLLKPSNPVEKTLDNEFCQLALGATH